MHSILIVDDDINLCEALSFELEELGYKTQFVNSAIDAVTVLSKTNYIDLILLDLKMPEKNGYFVLQQMLNKGIDKKVIVLTAYADVESAMLSIKLGADEFMNKPYDMDELLITIRKLLNS